MKSNRGILAALATAVVLLLTACGGLPTSGPVNIGLSIDADDGDLPVVYVPTAPAPGMTPQQIVEGFIAAGSGTRDDWGIARQYLASEIAETWNPRAAVAIYAPGDREFEQVADDEVVMTVTPEAAVDATGAYAVVVDRGEIRTEYRLAQQADGEWRITEAPDGIVLDRGRFLSVFHSYALMYFDPTWTYLVPEQRWFPSDNAATLITRALVDGQPGPWLADSVVTAFTEGTGLGSASVPVRSEVAEVTLRPAARDLDSVTLNRMQTQLEKSLATANVGGVEMVADGQVLTASAVAVRPTRVDTRALVAVDGYFGFLSGEELESIPGLSEAVERAGVDAVEVDADRAYAAIRTTDGAVGRARDDGTSDRYDARAGLLAPTIDTRGYVYAVPGDDPTAVVAYGADGTAHEIAGAWPSANRIVAMRVSRDGTRVAAIVRQGTRIGVQVSGIVRDGDGVPLSFGEPITLTIVDGEGAGLVWVDDLTLALAYSTAGESYLRDQPVGGPGSQIRARPDIAAVSAGTGSGSVRLLDTAGALYLQQGATWLHASSEVDVLAVQQGMPR